MSRFGPPRIPRPASPPAPLTEPEEIQLRTSKQATRKASSSSNQVPSSPFVPYVQKLASFHKTAREPPISMMPNSRSSEQKDDVDMKPALALTVAETPQLATKKRKRRTQIESTAEIEERELREIRSKKFKARPVMDIHTGFKPVDPVPPTKVQEFHFHQTKHPAYQPTPPRKFKARPYVPKVFEKDLDEIIAPAMPGGPLTCPVTPNLSKPRPRAKRSRSHSRDLEESQRQRRFKARPAPKFSSKAKKSCRSASSERDLRHKKRALTKSVAPNFRVDSRGRNKVARFAAMVSAEERDRKKSASYRAKKVPKASRSKDEKPTGIPEMKKFTPTVHDPFHLASVTKHEMSKAKFGAAINAEEQAATDARQFHALKAPKVKNLTAHEVVAAAREVAKAHASKGTEHKAMNFATDKRTVGREKFEADLKAKEAAREAENEVKALEEQEREKEAVAELRKQMVFVAQPIKEGKPVEIQPSERPRTEARTPDFKTTQRLGEFHRAPGLEEVGKPPAKKDDDEPWPAKKKLTDPKTPEFATTRRLGKRSVRKSETKSSSMPSEQSQSTNKKLTVTIPKSPDFATSRRLGEHRMAVPNSGEQKENLGANNDNQKVDKSAKLTLTLPKTPQFATSRRFGAPKIVTE